MKFKSKEDIIQYIKKLKELGFGSQGTVFLDNKNNEVIKVYHEFIDELFYDDYVIRDKEKFEKLININNNSYYFPKELIDVGSYFAGYKMDLAKGKSLYTIDPFKINYDDFLLSVSKVIPDIKLLSDNNIMTFDVSYNVLYDNKKISIIDSDEYSISNMEEKNLFQINNYNFSLEILYFLTNGLFEEFIIDNKELKDIYKVKDIDIVLFMKLFKKHISNYIDKEMCTLNDAKKLVNKREHGHKYQRQI